MDLNRETAMRLWNKSFGKVTKATDFAGRVIAKGAYNDRNSEFGWNVDHVLPQSKGGVTADYNLVCCHIKTNDEKANKFPGFTANGITFEIIKVQNHYEIRAKEKVHTAKPESDTEDVDFYDSASGLRFFKKLKGIQNKKRFVGTVFIKLRGVSNNAMVDFIEELMEEEAISYKRERNYYGNDLIIVARNTDMPLKVVCDELKALGFVITEEPIIESPHKFGIPQVRDRVYILGVKEAAIKTDALREKGKITRDMLDIDSHYEACPKNCIPMLLDAVADPKYYVPDELVAVLDIWEEFLQNVKGVKSPFWLHKAGLGIYDDEQYKNDPVIGYQDMPDWKKEMVWRTRVMYNNNHEFIDDWAKRHKMTERSLIHQKFEWNASRDCTTIKQGITQFRQSGVRVKNPDYFPSLVAMNNTPIVWDENAQRYRYLSPHEAAKRYGNQCVVISADVKRVDGVFRVFARGGRENTGLEAVSWIKSCVERGAGEVVLNSIDTDGVRAGFDLEMLARVCDAVNVPVIASGGAGCIDDFISLFKKVPKVDAGLAASIFHFGDVNIKELKKELDGNGIAVRL